MEFLALLIAHVRPFSIVLTRVVGVLSVAPIFGAGQVPIRVTSALSVLVTFVLYPVVAAQMPAGDLGLAGDMMLILRESAIGLALGFVSHTAFAGVQVAGQFMGFQMGFSAGEVADPMSGGGQINLNAQFYTILTTLTFVIIDGHHWFLLALSRSYEVVPVGGFTFSGDLMASLLRMFVRFYMLGAQMAVPMVACLVLASAAMGIVAKTVPQINIMQMGFALRIAIGVVCMITFLPLFHVQMRQLLVALRDQLSQVLFAM